jgi:hypothetical protein
MNNSQLKLQNGESTTLKWICPNVCQLTMNMTLQTMAITKGSFLSKEANYVRFQVLTAASMMFRAVFWVILPCEMIVDRRFRGAYCLHRQG